MLTIALGISLRLMLKGREKTSLELSGGLLLLTIVIDALIFYGILDAVLDVYRGVPCG